MYLPRFRIQTLMVAVAIVAAALAIIPAAKGASDFNRMIVIGCAILFGLGVVIPFALIVLFESLTPTDRWHPK